MRVEPERNNHRVVMAVDMRVHAEQPLHKLLNRALEVLGEMHAYKPRHKSAGGSKMSVDVGWGVCIPIRLGNICSLSIFACTHAMRCSMYSGAGILVGRLYLALSCQRYSNSSVAFISGHVFGEQNSVMEP